MGNTLNDEQLDFFRNKLEELLKKHYQHHWFPEKPNKGSGYRCLRINHKMDPLIAQAAMSSGVVSESSLLHNMFPNELTLWIDPREVSYRIGENGSICVLYDGTITAQTSNSMERYSTCKESLRGVDNMIMDPRNMNFDQYSASACVSSWACSKESKKTHKKKRSIFPYAPSEGWFILFCIIHFYFSFFFVVDTFCSNILCVSEFNVDCTASVYLPVSRKNPTRPNYWRERKKKEKKSQYDLRFFFFLTKKKKSNPISKKNGNYLHPLPCLSRVLANRIGLQGLRLYCVDKVL